MQMIDNVVKKGEERAEKCGGALLETMKLHAIIQITHLIDTERFDEACKLALAVERVARI